MDQASHLQIEQAVADIASAVRARLACSPLFMRAPIALDEARLLDDVRTLLRAKHPGNGAVPETMRQQIVAALVDAFEQRATL